MHPMLGGYVCKSHGGLAPGAKRKAAQRVRDMLADAIDPDHALREAGRLAYSDIRALFDEAGNILPVKQWPEGLARSIAGIDVLKRNVVSGDGKQDEVLKVRLWDKVRALEMLFKHLGLLKDTLEHSGEVKFTWEK